MWTIGQSPNGCASHAYRARKSAESMEMLAFAHIPTGTTTTTRKNYNFDWKEGERGAGVLAGSGRRDGPFWIEQRDGDLNKRRFDGDKRPWTRTASGV
jgi:hypothetical protein